MYIYIYSHPGVYRIGFSCIPQNILCSPPSIHFGMTCICVYIYIYVDLLNISFVFPIRNQLGESIGNRFYFGGS